MRKLRFFPVALSLLSAVGGISPAADRFQASLNFLMGYPQNEFRRNIDRTFYGLSGEFFFHFPRSPLAVGISLEYLNYGSERRVEPLSPDIPDVLVDVTTRNSLFSTAAVFRLSPVEGAIRPYIEALVGFNYLFTYTSVSDDGDWSEDIATTTNFDDWSLTYGAGAGAVIRALDIRSQGGRSLFSLHMEAGVRYCRGRAAEYLRQGAIRRDHGSLWYEPVISDTDLLKTHLGLVFRF
jgi:hypothetical protein